MLFLMMLVVLVDTIIIVVFVALFPFLAIVGVAVGVVFVVSFCCCIYFCD